MSDTWPAVSSPIYRIRIDRSDFSRWLSAVEVSMLEAPTLDHVYDHRDRNESAACCIFLAPRFSNLSRDEVIPRIGYLDHRSGKYVHFYCAGYGGYWHRDIVQDMEEIGDVKYGDGTMIPWAFSQNLFARFVDELERATKWRYSGDVELIMLGPNVDFSKALIFKVQAMVEDKAIRSSAELFEAIIRYCRDAVGDPSAYDFSDVQGAKELGKGVLDAILSYLPEPVRGVWEKGRHYAVKNIRTLP
jgi:hypothetical protein